MQVHRNRCLTLEADTVTQDTATAKRECSINTASPMASNTIL